MAIQPPPAPPGPAVPQQAGPPAAPRSSGCFGRGCGCGCGSCLLVAILAALLLGGGGWWLLVAQASAAVSASASLIVVNQPVTVDGSPGIPGQSLNAGNTVATGAGGHGAIDFPDGSFMRLAPGTTVQISSVQLQRNGNLQSVSLQQKVGRTFTNVQHLVNGATFEVGGHSVNAAVRGTQFEVLVRSDGTNRIWVFVGMVRVSGKTSATLSAGQEIDSDANGNLSNLRTNQFDAQDAFPLATQCSAAVSNGTTAGTEQDWTGNTLATGQSEEVDYNSPGGNVTMSLCYPGSTMSVSLVDPIGGAHIKSGRPPLTITAGGPPGLWKATIHALDVPGGEAYAISFATNAPCSADNVDTGGSVRETLSSSQISSALASSGASGVTIYVDGAKSSGARIVYSSDVGGVPVTWIIDFYAATPNLGAVITQVTVRGISMNTILIRSLSTIGGQSISSIPSGFSVDRVYSCAGANNDTLMVVEGHR